MARSPGKSAITLAGVAVLIPTALAYLALREDAVSEPSPPAEPAYLLDLADVHLTHGRHDQARAAYARAGQAATDPALRGRAEYGLALVAKMKKDLAGAVPHLEKAIELVPEDAPPGISPVKPGNG